MFGEPAVSSFEALPVPLESTREPSSETAVPTLEVRAKSAGEIAKEYNVSDKTVQIWFKAVAAAYCWFDPETLKTGKSAKTRYTPLCQRLIAEYRASASTLSEEDWIASVHAANPDKVPVRSTAQQQDVPLSPTEVLLQEDEHSPDDDRPAPSDSLIPTGLTFLAAIEEEEAQLLAIEARELRLLGRMGEGLNRLTHASQQWDRASQLRKQRMLRQTRLEAASLAVELEEEFENTLRETQYRIQNGNVPAPGKPQPEEPRSQSA